MKKLYESIFGSKQDLVKSADEAIKENIFNWIMDTFFEDEHEGWYKDAIRKKIIFRKDSKGLIVDLDHEIKKYGRIPKLTNGQFRWGKVGKLQVFGRLSGLLDDMPEEVDDMEISFVRLSSLQGIPRKIKCLKLENIDGLKNLIGLNDVDEIKIYNTPDLESLEGLPDKLDGMILKNCNNLETLKGCPKKLNEILIISGEKNKLKSLEGAPSHINEIDLVFKGDLNLEDCGGIKSADRIGFYAVNPEIAKELKTQLKTNIKAPICKKITKKFAEDYYLW